MTMRVGFVLVIAEVLIADVTDVEGDPCWRGLGLGARLLVWRPTRLPWASARGAEAPSAEFTDLEGNSCIAAMGGGGFSVGSIVDSSWASVPCSGATPIAMLGSLLSSLALPGVSRAAITITNRSESNRGWSVL